MNNIIGINVEKESISQICNSSPSEFRFIDADNKSELHFILSKGVWNLIDKTNNEKIASGSGETLNLSDECDYSQMIKLLGLENIIIVEKENDNTNKYTIEVTDSTITRTLIYNGETFSDVAKKLKPFMWSTLGASIETQLEEYHEETGYDIMDLIEAISDNCNEDIMEYLND